MSSSAPSLQMCGTRLESCTGASRSDVARQAMLSLVQSGALGCRRSLRGVGTVRQGSWHLSTPRRSPESSKLPGPCPDVAAALTDINHRASPWARGRWFSPPWIISHDPLMENRWKWRSLKPELRSLLWSR